MWLGSMVVGVGKLALLTPSRESSDLRIDDWLLELECAAQWNQELLLQLAGHLQSCVLLEWNLLDAEAEESLGRRL